MVKRILMVILIVLSLSLLLSIESDATSEDNLREIKIGNYTVLFDDEHLYVTCTTLDNDGKTLTEYVLNDLDNGTTIDHNSKFKIKASTRGLHYIAMLNGEKYAGTVKEFDNSVTESGDANTITFTIEKLQHLIKFNIGESEEYSLSDIATLKNIETQLGDNIIIPSVPTGLTKIGYVANIWNTAENGKGSDVSPGEMLVDETLLNKLCQGNCWNNDYKVTLYPKFEKKEYDIKYDFNGGHVDEEIAKSTIKIDETITVTGIIPQKEGSTFKSWKIGDNLVNANENYILKREDILLSDNTVTITAQWSASVNSNLSHCTLTTSFEYADYGEEWSATLTPDGHYELPSGVTSDCFIYTLNSDGTATITVSNVTEAITISITAVPIEHTITLDPDGGTLEGSNTITVNEVSNVSLPTPVKARHVFNGWFDDTTKITETKSFTSDKTLKASWTKTVFLVRFLNAPDGAVLSSCETSGPVTKPSENPTKSGCTFIKWTSSTAGDFTGTVTDDTEYHPEWSANKVRFYLDEDAESYDEYETLKLTELPTPPARDGWKFDHWYYYSNGIETEYTLDNKDNNIVYAKWIKITFIVRFYSDEGDTNPSEYVTTGTIAEPAEKPTKSGYTFVKWTSSTAGDFTGTVTDDTDYYPVWSANKVRFYLDEDAEPYDEYETLKLTELPTPPSREGWKFDHWYYYSNGIETEYTLDNKDNNSVYAKWIKTIFQVNFYDDIGGKVISSCKTTGPVTVLPTEPTKEGYAFDYWITLSNKKFTGTVTGDTDYYPEWREVHTVSFYLNEGDEIPYVEYDAYLMDSLPTPERYGWKFDYWYCYADDGTEKKFIGDIGEDVKVYASWTQTIFNVRFFDNDGGTVIHTCECETGKTFDKPTENPTKTGYSFVCWMSSDGEYSGTVTKDTEYYPKWKENTIRFYLRDGVTVCKECKGPELTDLPVPAEEYGWKFDHWYYESGEDKIEFTGDIGRDVDVYSLWIKTVFKVRFLYDPDGDVYEEYETTGAVTVPETNPSRTGYSFMGWTSSDGGLKTTVANDTDFYAEWVAHKVSFYLNEGDETPYRECEIPTMTELPEPDSTERWKFSHWYYKSGDEKIKFTEGIGRDVDVYGSWIKTLFYVNFLNDSEGDVIDHRETKGSITDPITPAKTGYSFVKWTSSTAGDFTGTVTDDTEYHPVWSANKVRFYLDEDAESYDEYETLKLTELPIPSTREGWKFDYWYYYSNGIETEYTLDNKDSNSVYAKWIKTVFQVNFYNDDGSIVSKCKTEGSVTAPVAPEKPGYAFVRWITSSNKEFTGTVTDDTDYFPDWREVHIISFYLNESDTKAEFEYDAHLLKELPNPAKYGWKFDYWYYYDNDTKIKFIGGFGEEVKVYASWTQTIFNVRFFDDDGGTVIHTSESKADGTFDKPTVNPTKTGYSFVRWKSSDGEYNDSVTKDTDYFPDWKENTIRFYSKEGETSCQEYRGPELTDLPVPTEKYGWKFDYWYYKSGEDKIKFTGDIGRDVDVYGSWIKTIFKVRFLCDPDGIVHKEYETTGVVTVPETNPSRTGYSFVKWISSTAEDFTGKVTDDTDYCAMWSVNVIKFYLDEGGKIYSKFDAPDLTTLPAAEPREGWEFDYWYCYIDGEKVPYTVNIKTNTDVYASWKEVSDESGGSSEGGGTTLVTDPSEETSPDDTKEGDKTEKKTYEHRFYTDSEGKKIWRIGDSSGISETPTRDGYTFGGWYILIDGEKIPYTEGLNVDINVYAEWIPIKTDGGGNPMIPAAAIASVLAVVLIVLVVGRKIS